MHLIPNTTLAYEIEKLDHAIYAEENQDWLGETLWDAFLEFEKQKKTKSHSEDSNPLPPLYPE
jgi:hypothetical protein